MNQEIRRRLTPLRPSQLEKAVPPAKTHPSGSGSQCDEGRSSLPFIPPAPISCVSGPHLAEPEIRLGTGSSKRSRRIESFSFDRTNCQMADVPAAAGVTHWRPSAGRARRVLRLKVRGRHTIGTQRKRESPSLDSPISLTDCLKATYTVGTAGFEPATP